MKAEPAGHLTDPHAAAAGEESEVVLSADRPWPGMRPYREQDARFYFGRGVEIEDLLARTERSLLTLLYGRGGLGKTSLVRAGLAPRLVECSYLPVYLRPRGLLDGGRDPIVETIRAVEAAAAAGHIKATAAFDTATLWELFHREDFDLWDADNRLVTPVLVFDQFEEIFQVIDDDAAAAPRVKALLDGIAELVENRLPARLARPEAADAGGPRFDTAAKDYRVILSFREDYLPQVRKLRAIVPSVIENHVRLEPLSGRQALEVVEGAGRELIDRDAATKLVRSVGRRAGLLQLLLDPDAALPDAAGNEVLNLEIDPAILSVVCFHLNSERRRRGQSTIDVGLVAQKTPEDIFDDYYSASVGQVSAVAREFVQTSLVTAGGERVLYPMRAVETQGPALAGAVNQLLEQGILRKEWFAGEQRVEISHDLLLRPIRRAVELRRRSGAARRRKQRAFMALGAVVLVAGGAAAWYGMDTRLKAELAQREEVAEALLVAYTPLAQAPARPDQLKNEMAEKIIAIDAAADAAQRIQRLEQLYDLAVRVGADADGNNARRLQDFSIDYIQMKIDGFRIRSEDIATLLPKLRDGAGLSCKAKILTPDVRIVTWFGKRGGVPKDCL